MVLMLRRKIDNLHDVNKTHANSKNHVNNSENNGQLHFERVQVDNLVFRQHPYGIYPKRIGFSTVSIFWIQHVSFIFEHIIIAVTDFTPT